MPSFDPKVIARTHFNELQQYTLLKLAAPANSRSTARQKLTRLTKQQFQELSTNVYDELIRRRTNTVENETHPRTQHPVPPRDEFYPKRNQARQKLATLPTARFEDLSSDAYFELSIRYPEFKEENEVGAAPVGSPGSAYDDMPSPEFHASPRLDAAVLPPGSRIADMDLTPSAIALRTTGSRDTDRRRRLRIGHQSLWTWFSEETVPRHHTRANARLWSPTERSDSTGTTNAQSATATSGMIIPNKSTIAEEDIEVPYGREEGRDSSVMAVGDRGRDGDRDTYGGMDEEHEHDGPPVGGLSALGARLRNQVSVDILDDEDGIEARSGEDYFDKVSLGRASVTSDRSTAVVRNVGGRVSVGADEHERLRREHEFKIATMQGRIVTLERDLVNAEQREKELRDGHQRIKLLEEEIDGFRKRAEEHGAVIRTLQKELDELHRLERLEDEHGGLMSRGDSDMIEQLRSDMEDLMTELADLGRRNDELMTAKDADLALIRDLDNQLKEHKRKHELAKTELRSVKATSQLYMPVPKMDDQMPMAADGRLIDIPVTAFVSGTDSLLAAGRTNAPTRVLMPMKAVVNSTSAIIEDVRVYELRPTRVNVDIHHLRSLRERLEATLSNLVAATKTHAMSSGMSPVSLLDAAASRVSATVTDISRMICIRKATRAEQEEFSVPSLPSQPTPPLRTIEELRSGHDRRSFATSSRCGDGDSPAARFLDRRGASSSEPSSSSANSPPPILDKSPIPSSGVISDDSAPPEDAWSELEPYLEAQTESIVYAIQSVLSGVRTPIPAPTLNENLTQIITIVSSIVAVCSGNVSPASAQQGAKILEQLSEHARPSIHSHMARIAILDALITIDYEPRWVSTHQFEMELIASHMRSAFFAPDSCTIDDLRDKLDEGLIDLDQKGEVVVCFLLWRAYINSIIREKKDMPLRYVFDDPFARAFHTSVLNHGPDNIAEPSPPLSELHFKMQLFTRFVKATYGAAMTTRGMAMGFLRGAAIIGYNHQESIDIAVPVFLNRNDKIEEASMSAFLIQVKRRNQRGSVNAYPLMRKGLVSFLMTPPKMRVEQRERQRESHTRFNSQSETSSSEIQYPSLRMHSRNVERHSRPRM
ncbi:hypothetical protein V8E55_011919 [Tylopilus felleus]